jgi:hypothetical protein
MSLGGQPFKAYRIICTIYSSCSIEDTCRGTAGVAEICCVHIIVLVLEQMVLNSSRGVNLQGKPTPDALCDAIVHAVALCNKVCPHILLGRE